MVLLIQIAGKGVFNLGYKGTSVIDAKMYVNLNCRLHGIFYGVQMLCLLHLF